MKMMAHMVMVIIVVMMAHSPDSEPHQPVLDPSENHRRLLSLADPDPPSPETPAQGFSPAPETPPSGAREKIKEDYIIYTNKTQFTVVFDLVLYAEPDLYNDLSVFGQHDVLQCVFHQQREVHLIHGHIRQRGLLKRRKVVYYRHQ